MYFSWRRYRITECNKHFVNINTIEKIQSANRLYGYNDINIVPPIMLLGGDEDDN